MLRQDSAENGRVEEVTATGPFLFLLPNEFSPSPEFSPCVSLHLDTQLTK